MTVIISRDRKHVHLGRMLTTTTAKIQMLSDIKKMADMTLKKMSQLDTLYSEWENVDFPPDILEKLAQEKSSVSKIASSYVMINEVLTKELRGSIQDLDTYETQLNKAEKAYQKLIKKAEKKASPPPQLFDETPSITPTQDLISAVSDALIKAENQDKHKL